MMSYLKEIAEQRPSDDRQNRGNDVTGTLSELLNDQVPNAVDQLHGVPHSPGAP